MPVWRYAQAIRRYAKLFIRLHGFTLSRKSTAAVAVRVQPKLISRFSLMCGPRGVMKRSSGNIFQQFRAALRNLVALQYTPSIAYKHAQARENLHAALERRFKRIAARQTRISAFDRIHNIFITNAPTDYSLMRFPDDINEYEIGEFIGGGQNAAVYELRDFKKSTSNDDPLSKNGEDQLAVKMIYNFNFNEPAELLWTDCRNELLPFLNKSQIPAGSIANFRPLRRSHPNIIRIHTAFLSEWKQLARAERYYPAVLPSVENYGCVPTNPRTLYVVMQRYQMTLDDYMDKVALNYLKAHVMFGQLLEAVAYLYDQKISHRDLKANNILLNFNSQEQCPHLVLSDFGCALSTGSWELHYNKPDIELGGNIAHLPPEVIKAQPSGSTWINYSKADIWAAGLIGYEIFDRTWFSEREQLLDAATNVEFSQPLFIGTPLGYIMESMLQKDPKKRVEPNVAADVVSMMLFRIGDGIVGLLKGCMLQGWRIGHSISALYASTSKTIQCLSERIDAGLDEMISLYATDTVLSRRVMDPVEYQLRTTFMRRIEKDHVWTAFSYFDERD